MMQAAVEYVYVATLTGKTNVTSAGALEQGNRQVKKKFKPCYSNESLHVFCSAEPIEKVRGFLEHTCSVLPLDYILVQTDRGHFHHSSPAVGRCFDGSLTFDTRAGSGGLGSLHDTDQYTRTR